MNKIEFKKMIKECIKEIAFPDLNATLSHISNKPTIHLSYYKGQFVLNSPRDKKLMDDEFGENNYGQPYKDDPTMRYFTIKNVIEHLDYFNILLTGD